MFENDCTENTAKLGVLRMSALKTLQKLGVLRIREKTTQTFGCRVRARVHWMEMLQIVTWDGCKNTYKISVACFCASVWAMAFASLRQSIFEK